MVHGRQRIDSDHRMDRRKDERDVAHVSRSGRAAQLDARNDEMAPERLAVALIQRRKVAIADQFRVRFIPAFNIQLRAGRGRARRKTFQDPRSDLVQVSQGARAYHIACRGVRRDDVGRFAAVGDDAVDAVGGMDVLAEQADRRLRDHQCIGRVDS
ncbi:MAG TPA: hypothetical protein VGI29_01095 [Candidatus Binataceae bacterium]